MLRVKELLVGGVVTTDVVDESEEVDTEVETKIFSDEVEMQNRL